MRPYRAKRKDNGEWVYGWYAKAKTCSVIILQDCHIYEFLSDGIEVDSKTVGQQIGLCETTARKKEIYENDKVIETFEERFPVDDNIPEDCQGQVMNSVTYEGVVMFKDARFGLETKEDGFVPLTSEADELEIIGNTYEEAKE